MDNESLHINELKPFFSEKETFSTKNLETFFKKVDPDISKTTVHWRIRQLVEKGIIKRVGHGIYSTGESKKYVPHLNQAHKELFRELKGDFPYSDLCLWETSILNRFMLHQPFRFMTIVEADTDTVESVFYKLQEKDSTVFLGADHELIDRYGFSEKRITIVKLLVSEAPTQETDGVITVTLEKVLVDLFCDEMIFSTYQGNERSIIFKNAFNDYTLNQNKILRYAQRRGKREEVKEYLDYLRVLKIETGS
ncbi:MAG: DUF6577 family protein [Candidatus Paceibacterota bacterium]